MFADRNRSGTYVIMLSLAAAMFGMFFFITLFVQNVLGYSPIAGRPRLPAGDASSIALGAGRRLAAPAQVRARSRSWSPARCSPRPGWPG